eukprot:CAMPEP_0170554046 /NCGR_PEP_ID=MMETSP0211-20121228/11916_1 /TAXON_ID=311385 /ORGANISM="Pseudokeronopsis sp., Strain OXSARD2" /LENGTH=70 /DNA_ID=CAMNT_0010862847 /DNA_START=514 /DNA_END=723 /DNA_ORIENTATION=-
MADQRGPLLSPSSDDGDLLLKNKQQIFDDEEEEEDDDDDFSQNRSDKLKLESMSVVYSKGLYPISLGMVT